MWLFFVFIAIPLVEIALFVTLGGLIGLWATLAWVVLTALLGIGIMRRLGQTGRSVFAKRIVGTDLLSPIAHQILLAVAAVLLILPGFFTDFQGLLLLLPFVRDGLIYLAKRRIGSFSVQTSPSSGPVIIDGEYEVYSEPPADPDRRRLNGHSGWVNPDERQH